MYITVNNNSPIQDYVHPGDQTQPTFEMGSNLSQLYIFLLLYSYTCFFVLLGDPYYRVDLWVSFFFMTALICNNACYFEIKYCIEAIRHCASRRQK